MQAPTLQEVTIEYADSFDATLLPISQRYLRSPARATTPEFDPGWRLHFASRRRVNGFHDYDTAYEGVLNTEAHYEHVTSSGRRSQSENRLRFYDSAELHSCHFVPALVKDQK